MKRLSNDMFSSFDFLITFPALDAVSAKLFLPLDLLRCQLWFGQFKPSDKFQINLNLLHPIPVNLFRGVDNDFSINSLIIGVVSSEKSVYFFASERNCAARSVSSSKEDRCDSASDTDVTRVFCSASYSASRVSKRSSVMRPMAKRFVELF